MCVTLSTLYISYVRMHMATLQYLLQEIFMLMSSCISTIERMFSYDLFYKKVIHLVLL